MHLRFVTVCLALASYPALTLAALPQPQFREELLQMAAEDRRALHQNDVPPERLLEIQHVHTARLKELVGLHGWPGLSMVGKEASQGAWLLVQHADDDRAWQRRALVDMEALADLNDINKSDVAYLRDRLDVADKLPQRYGTQGACIGPGAFQPFPLAAPDSVDERRARMDLTPLAAYVKMASERMCKNFSIKPANS